MKLKFIIPLLFVVVFSGCTYLEEDIIRLDNRLVALEQDRPDIMARDRKLELRLGESLRVREERDQQVRDHLATLRIEIENLRAENGLMAGRIEELGHLLEKRMQGLDRVDEKRDSRLDRIEKMVVLSREEVSRLEQYLHLEKDDKESSTAESTTPMALSESESYDAAKDAFDKGDFVTARDGFKKLITTFPKSENVDNAQFWIGETYYREKWFEKAILEYQKVIEQYPKGNKVQASLLKQGFSFFSLGDSANARLILKELITKFPKSNEAQIARKKIAAVK
jgi:tol-pal system protein YbgF